MIAVCDMNEEAAAKAAKTYDAPKFFRFAKNIDELPETDAISIITPNRTHRPLALQALQAGKHVFCEKPPALNAGEVAEMKAAAEAFGKTLMFNFNNRARPESYAFGSILKPGKWSDQFCSGQGIRRTGIPVSEDGSPTRSFRRWAAHRPFAHG